MTTAGSLELEIADLDALETPPCEAVLPNFRICGRPSEVRVKGRCNTCRGRVQHFLCGSCWEKFRRGRVICSRCDTPGDFTVRES